MKYYAREDNKWQLKETAEPIDLPGFEEYNFFICSLEDAEYVSSGTDYEESGYTKKVVYWAIFEAISGRRICTSKAITKEEAKIFATKELEKHGKEETNKYIKEGIMDYGISPGYFEMIMKKTNIKNKEYLFLDIQGEK
jgi:hypothetical protein